VAIKMMLMLKIVKLLVVAIKVIKKKVTVIKEKKKLLILQLDLSVRHLMWVLMDLLSLLNVRFSLMSLTLEIFMKNIN